MNNKGQSLVFFVALIPLLFIIFAFIFDTSLIIRENNRLESITTSAINYLAKENKPYQEVENIIKENDKEINILIINNEEISLQKNVDSTFGKIIGFKNYEIKTDMTFKIENAKQMMDAIDQHQAEFDDALSRKASDLNKEVSTNATAAGRASNQRWKNSGK